MAASCEDHSNGANSSTLLSSGGGLCCLDLQEMGRIPVLCTKKKMLQKILKKPSKTKQRNPCHKLHPSMSKIPTGDLLLDLLSKATEKVRTSLTQNQTLDFRTNMGLFCSTETSRNAKGLVKNSLFLAKSVFMARFRHSMA